MRFTHFFIERPIFATVMSLIFVLLGSLSFFSLPVAQYPEVVPPTVQVRATYPGADAATLAATVATPLEQEINGVDDMLYMYSQSAGDGQLTITITFKQDVNLDDAQVMVQNRIAAAESRLPEEVRQLGVVARKQSTDMLMVVHLFSPQKTHSQQYIANFGITQIRDELLRIPGVGDILTNGAGEYAMRVWLDPERLAALDLTPDDVQAALRSYNVQVAAGTLNQTPTRAPGAFQVNVRTQGRLVDPEQFADVIVKQSQGRITRLRDIGKVELGQFRYATTAFFNDQPASAMLVFQKPGANALETSRQVQERMRELSSQFPYDVSYAIIYNPTEFVEKSLDEVYFTLFEAVLCVIFVVVLFLGNWRSAIIPIVAIPISLIGTFVMMSMLGFSLNMLSLFGLVLAIGIVVDDAIVVVENIERHMEEGASAREAAHKTMDEVGSALVSIALVLSAVFIPTAFIPGITGTFFQQFALTIAVSTIISMLVSLTLSPALGALFLQRPEHGHVDFSWRHPFRWLTRSFNEKFDKLAARYGQVVARLVRRGGLVGIIYLVLIGVTGLEFAALPSGFIPQLDRGYLIVAVQLPPGAQLERTDAVMKQAVKVLHETEGLANTVGYTGWSPIAGGNDSNTGTVFVMMDDYGDRLPSSQMAALVQRQLMAIPEATFIVVEPTPVFGLGNGGFRLMVQDRGGRGSEVLQNAVQELVIAANQDPHLTRVFTTFNTNTPYLHADIDRTKAEMLGVPLANIHSALQNYIGSGIANDFNFLGRAFRVMVQADEDSRRTADDIARLRVRNSNGELVPLGSMVTFRETAGAYRIPHYNIYPAAAIDGAYRPGVGSKDGIAAMEALAEKILPDGISYEWTDLAYQEKQIGNTAGILFALAVVFVFLVLAAQYESWLLPLAVILIVPMCLLCAFTGLLLRGIENSILAQIGFVVLIGLASKNAILIVQFASDLEKQGLDRFDAVIKAAGLRLRPIVMTSMAFILGVLPLVFATGAGKEMRQALGTAVFSGMLGVTVFGLLFTPVFYVMCRKFAERRERAAAIAQQQAQ